MLNYFGVWCYAFSFPSSCVWVPQVQRDGRELSKQTCQLLPLSVLVRQDCQKGKALPERFPKVWHLVFWGVCGGNDVEGQGVYFWWLGFFECLVFLNGGEGRGPVEKGTFRKWLERESRLWGEVAVWQGGSVLLFLCLFVWGRNLLSLNLTQGGSLSAPWANWFSLGEERIGNISSNPPTVVDGVWRTTEDILF